MTNPNDLAMPANNISETGDHGTTYLGIVGGLTKREYFAALAMQSMAQYPGGVFRQDVAKQSVEYADALIAALNNNVSQ